MHEFTDTFSPHWSPQWKEFKGGNGYLYVAQADNLLWPKGILVKPVVGKQPIDPKIIRQGLLIGYYQESAGIPEPKEISIINSDSSIMVNYSPFSTLQQLSEISPHSVQAYAKKEYITSEVITNISTYFEEAARFGREEIKGGNPIKISNIASANILRGVSPVIQWDSYNGYQLGVNTGLIEIKKGVVRGIEDQTVKIVIRDPDITQNKLIEVEVDSQTGKILITQYDWEGNPKGARYVHEINTEQKLDSENIKTLMTSWDVWQNIISGIADQKLVEQIFTAAVKLDKRVIKIPSYFSES